MKLVRELKKTETDFSRAQVKKLKLERSMLYVVIKRKKRAIASNNRKLSILDQNLVKRSMISSLKHEVISFRFVVIL